MKILTPEQIHQADTITIKKQQITSIELMERAGTKLFEWLNCWLQGSKRSIHIFCGVGNNGGDGLVVARLLTESDYDVTVYIVNYSEKHSNEFYDNLQRYQKLSGTKVQFLQSVENLADLKTEDLIIDAIFGIGLNRSPQGWVK